MKHVLEPWRHGRDEPFRVVAELDAMKHKLEREWGNWKVIAWVVGATVAPANMVEYDDIIVMVGLLGIYVAGGLVFSPW